MSLHHKIKIRQAVVSVVGLGHAGLPLAAAFAEGGFRVVGIDVDQDRVESINRGVSDVEDVSSERLARLISVANNTDNEPRLRATTGYDSLAHSDVAVICVPTPLSKTKDPDISQIVSVVDEIAKRLHRDMLVVLESTTYPTTTEELVLPRLMENSARVCQDNEVRPFEVGVDFFLAFSPERIDPGRTDWTISSTPKVVGGVTKRCTEVSVALYGCIVQQVVPVSSPRVAEMVKLLENIFRATNVALVNEVAIMCDRLDIDVWEVIEGTKTKPFGFMPFYPGPGLGGHCIPIDPQYLAWKLKTLDYHARFIQLAADINFGMPAYVVGKISDALNEDGKPLKGSRILVLGVAYKADVSDLRESPALDLIEVLRRKGASVAYHDPYVPRIEVDEVSMERVALEQQTLREADCVVIATAHDSYDWRWVVENSRLIMDTRNATADVEVNQGKVVKL